MMPLTVAPVNNARVSRFVLKRVVFLDNIYISVRVFFFLSGLWSNGMMPLSHGGGTEFDSPQAHVVHNGPTLPKIYK